MNNKLPVEIFINEIFDFLPELYYFKIGLVCKLWRELLCEKLQTNHSQGLTVLKYKKQEDEWSEEQFDISLPIKHLLIIKSQFKPIYWNRFMENPNLSFLKRFELIGVPIGNKPLKLIANCKYLNRLEKLVLIGCSIGDAGVKFLVSGAKNLMNLKYLDLSVNLISDNGVELILSSEFTLEELYITNNNLRKVSFSDSMSSLSILKIEDQNEVESVHDMHMEIYYETKSYRDEDKSFSLHHISQMLQHRKILNVPTRVALEMLYESACLGYAPAQYRIGKVYHNECEPDFGFPHNIELALEFLKKAAEQNLASAMALLSVMYEDIGDMENSYQWCMKAALLDNSSSMIRLGYMLDTGNEFVKVDHVRALEMYEKAITIERCTSNYYLMGSMYHEGRTDDEGNSIIEQDFTKAFENYKKCLELDKYNNWANYHIGIMYKYGEGMEIPNIKLAHKHLTRSAELGNEFATQELENGF